ncbi:MAG: T9SS type A sorting domain-containing protein [Prolixibacteraceae bacterium]|nr:T9SS type A sorting domain-containing protein [Prolixibacteraceae bacterium]
MNRTRLLTNMLAFFFLLGINCVSAKSNGIISTGESYLDAENPVVEEHDGVPAIMLTFTQVKTTPQQINGSMGSISVKASGSGTIMFKLGVMGTWQTSGSFTGLTAGTYTVWAKDAVNTKGISTSATIDYVVYIPDANFKANLLARAYLNTNGDGEIQVTEAESYTGGIDVTGGGIADVTGIEAFTDISTFDCTNNAIAVIDVSANLALNRLECGGNNLTELDVSANSALEWLECNDNELTGLDVSSNLALERLVCRDNSITELNVSSNESLTLIDCSNNLLTSLNVKNGNNTLLFINAQNNSLTCITVDDVDYSTSNWFLIDEGVVFSLNCNDPPPVINDVTVTQINCNGYNDGSIEIDASEGIGTISYSIDDGGTWQLSNFFGSLPPGEYNVKVKDENGYVAAWGDNPVAISEPAYDPVNIDAITETQNADKTWNYEITASGGITPYLYRIDDGAWQSSNLFEDYAAATYTMYVQDGNGCEDSHISYEIIEIPDTNFKTYLVGSATINLNGDTEIQINEAEAFNGTINVGSLGVADMTGIEYFINITRLWCYDNALMTELNVSNNIRLINIECWITSLTGIDLSQNELLEAFDCHGSNITELDLSNQTVLERLNCSRNSLISLDLRNGNNDNISSISCTNNAALTCVSVDDPAYAAANWSDDFDEGVTFSLECENATIIEDVVIDDVTGCYGDSNGAISVTASGGTGALSYSIDEGETYQSSGTFSSLSAGSYNVVVKDEAGDSVIWSSNPAVVSQPDELSFDVSYDHPQCIGSTNGEINFSNTSGGTGTYLFSADGGGTYVSGSSFTGLSAGSYNLYMKDDNDCEVAYSGNPLSLNDPSHNIIEYVNTQNVLGCAGDETGTIAINAELPESVPLKSTQAAITYEYSIDGGDIWQTQKTFESLPAGEYTAIVGVDGCEYPWDENPVVITEPDSVIITAVDITADTGSSSGVIEITAEGGSNTFTYSIDGGSTFVSNSTFNGLAAGEYTVVVQDTETCQADSVVTVPDVSIEISDVATTDVTGCYGDENGSITITASGGDGTLAYSIDDGVTWQSSEEFSGLAAGSYNVRVKDENEHEVAWGENPVTLSQPDEISFFVSSLAPNCAGESTGVIRILSNTGGTGSFSFSIDGGDTWDPDSIFINLPAGSYNIVVKDANECEMEYAANPRVLTDPDPFEIGNVVTTDNTHCSGDGNGTIQISLAEPESTLKSVNGLAPVYYYSIDNGDTWHEDSPLFEGLSSGSYQVLAMNENQCTDEWDTNPVEIADVNTLEIDTFRVADDDGTGTGEIEVIVTGGTTPYEYRLDDGAWQTSQLFESLFAGTYLLQVSDSTGCEDSRSITVEEEATVPETETIAGTTFEDGDDQCFGATLTITVGGEGGDAVDFESGSSTLLIAGESVTFLPGTHIQSGSYLWAFITTDESFCDDYGYSSEAIIPLAKSIKNNVIEVQSNDAVLVSEHGLMKQTLKVYPNPNNGRFNIQLTGFSDPVDLAIYNSVGAVVKRLFIYEQNTSMELMNLKQGIYFVKAICNESSLNQKIVIR